MGDSGAYRWEGETKRIRMCNNTKRHNARTSDKPTVTKDWIIRSPNVEANLFIPGLLGGWLNWSLEICKWLFKMKAQEQVTADSQRKKQQSLTSDCTSVHMGSTSVLGGCFTGHPGKSEHLLIRPGKGLKHIKQIRSIYSVSPQVLSGLPQQSERFAADWIWFWPVSGQADGNTCTSPGSSGSWCNPYKQWRCYRRCQSWGCHWGERSGNPFPLSHSFPAETPGTPLKSAGTNVSRDSAVFLTRSLPLVCPATAAFERRKKK